MAKTNGGAMSKTNARQNSHNKAKYERQSLKTMKNKAHNIAAQKAFEDKKVAEKGAN